MRRDDHSLATYQLQVIELDLDQLPEKEDMISILRDERAPLYTWVALAVSSAAYYKMCGHSVD